MSRDGRHLVRFEKDKLPVIEIHSESCDREDCPLVEAMVAGIGISGTPKNPIPEIEGRYYVERIDNAITYQRASYQGRI